MAEAEGDSVESYVETLIREDGEWRGQSKEMIDESAPEFSKVHAAVAAGLAQMHMRAIALVKPGIEKVA